MNALVRKEIRLVLPAWIVAMVLAVAPVWLLWPGPHGYFLQSPGDLVYTSFAIGVLLLGLSSFGQELNYGTFSILLAQPVPRRRLWRVKTVVLAAALVLAFLALFLSIHLRVDAVVETLKTTAWRSQLNLPKVGEQLRAVLAQTRTDALFESLIFGGVSALAAFAGGLWTNLLFRNTSAAFWFALLVPLGLGMLAAQLFGADETLTNIVLVAVLGGYSTAGFFWARRFFLRVQDVQWTGGVLSLPAVFGARSGSTARTRKPIRALVRKEFQLQQVNVLIAGLILLTHLADLVVRKLAAGYFAQHQMAAMIWGSWPFVWLAMPLLIGGVAVAEERKLGTLENFLCLPTSRRREFIVKSGTALALGIFLGGVMPWVVEWLGTRIGLPLQRSGVAFAQQSVLPVAFAFWLVIPAALTFLSFYASTLTRNLLQAMGLAVVLSVGAAGTLAAVRAAGLRYGWPAIQLPWWSFRLAAWVGVPVMALTILLLARRNFTHSQVGWRVWGRNALWLAGSLACAALATTAIYHRVWELWMPSEPPHPYYGIGRNPTWQAQREWHWHLSAGPGSDAVVLPGGRLWVRQRALQEVHVQINNSPTFVKALRRAGPWRAGFVGGTDWLHVAVAMRRCVGIRTDGTLWQIQWNKDIGRFDSRRFASGDDWRAISGSWDTFLALRQNGTLWDWSEGSRRAGLGAFQPVTNTTAPVQMGTDTNWVAICADAGSSVAMKSDGSIWCWGLFSSVENGRSVIQYSAVPVKWLSGPRKPVVSLAKQGPTIAAVYSDGTLWLGGYLPRSSARTPVVAHLVRLGRSSDWTQALFMPFNALVALKRQGSLWMWNWNPPNTGPGWNVTPEEISDYSDWAAIGASYIFAGHWSNTFVALTRGGLLVFWNHPEGRHPFYFYPGNSLLAPSRIKATRIANLWPNSR